MSLLDRVQQASFRQHRRASTPGIENDFWYSDPGVLSNTGQRVSPEAALTLSAFWQGSRLIGEGVAGFPCHLFRRKSDEGRERLRGDLAYRLRWEPNSIQVAYDFWQQTALCMALRGLFIAEKRDGVNPASGAPDTRLDPIHPDLVKPKKLPSGRVLYEVQDGQGGVIRRLTQDQVFVVRGRTEWDGVTPMSMIRYGAQSIGTALAADQFAGQFFRSGTAPALAVIDKDELGPEGIANLHASITAYVGGLKNAFGVLPLENDVKIEKLGISPHDAQLILTRQFSVEEVARWLNVPLHMLRHSQSGTGSYASLEVFSAEFVTYTLRPFAIAIEQSIARDLIVPEQKEEIFAEFNMDALLRGDLKSRYEAYRIGIMSGFLRRNEARIKENLDPAEGLDTFWEPLNMASADSSAGRAGGEPPRVAQLTAALRNGREAYRTVSLAQQTAGRVLRKERAAIESLAKRHANDPDGWASGLRTFYETHAGYVSESLRIPLPDAREYAARQGALLQRDGVSAMQDWDWTALEQLALLALAGVADESAAA